MMKRLRALCAVAMSLLIAGSPVYTAAPVLAQAVQLPNAEQCFQATTGINGMVAILGTITGGSGGTAGTYVNVPLTGGSGSAATANITVAGGAVTAVAILNPGLNYTVSDQLSALSANIGGTSGFLVPVLAIAINSAVAGGFAGMYIPGTLTPKQTWRDAGQTILNSNPVNLDANGCAVMYGAGTYRQIIYDSLGNIIWDKPTSVAPINPYYAGISGGTANVITVTDPSFAGTSGQIIQFLASATNTGPATINPSSFGAISVLKNTPQGPIPLVGGEIVAGNLVTATYVSSTAKFYIDAITTPSNCTSINNFGGTGDNSTDNTAAFNAAWASSVAAHSTSACVEFGEGLYYFGSSIAKTLTSTQAATIKGQGSRVSEMQFASGHGITINYVDYTNASHWQNISISTRGIGSSTGVTLHLSGTNLAPALSALSNFNNVEFRGADGWAVTDYWSIGLFIDQVSNVVIDGSSFYGQAPTPRYTGVGVGISIAGSSTNIVGQILISNSLIDYIGTGIVLGSDQQGIFVTATNFNGGETGIHIPSGSNNPDQLTITASHFDCGTNAIIDESGTPNLMVTASQFIVQPSGVGINLVKSSIFSLIGNDFNAGQGPNLGQTYISVQDAPVYGGVITGNAFVGATTAIYLQPASTRVNVQSNLYVSNTTDVNDLGSGNTIGGGSQ